MWKQKLFLLLQEAILINLFLWFAFGLVLQPVTFRIDLPQTTIGNGFSLLTNSNCFPCYHQDLRSFSNDHTETSSLFKSCHHLILIIITLSKIEKQWFHCCKSFALKTTLRKLITQSMLIYLIYFCVQSDSPLLVPI